MALKILNIIENEELCRVLCRFLEANGQTVSCMLGCSDALRTVQEIQPDLVIIEVATEKVGFLEIKQRLKSLEETRHIPVIVISDHPELEFELLKVFDFIPKPVDLERLQGDVAILEKGGKKRPAPARETLGESDYRLFRDYLVAFSGLHFDRRNLRILERALQSRMAALRIGGHLDYYDYLIRHRESRQELQKLLQYLTVGETYFFRYHPHFKVLQEFLVKDALGDRKRRIRLWSAGCSTGEEPYSMAMTVMETIPDWKKRDIRILATDINNRALKRARDGVYPPWSMRAMEGHYLERYFEKIGKSYLLNDEVKSLVEFSHLNLQTDEFPGLSGKFRDLDAIFCRNVMIYFTPATMKKVVERLATSLVPGGHLFLGHAENLSYISTQFERHSQDGAFYYRKKNPASTPPRQESMPVAVRRPAAPPPPPLPVKLPPVREKGQPPAPDAGELFRRALALFDAEKFAEASHLLHAVLEKKPDHVGAMVTRGFILANNGNVQEALDACQEALAVNDLCPEAYFLKGLILDINDRLREAREEYQKAILLKADFVMPHYNLGRLFFRLAREKEGLREFRNTLKILEKNEEERIIPYSGGMSREVFMEQLRSELARVA